MLRRLYDWTIELSKSPRAPYALAAVSFAESSFFPVPPDVMLVPMALANPRRAWFYAGVCTLASVAGGLLGYAIGALLYDTIGHWLVSLYGYGTKMEQFRELYQQHGHWVILIKGLTPIPYKLVTIASGLAGYSLFWFVALSLVTRGIRFYAVAGLFNWLGEPARHFIERHLTAVALGSLAAIVLGFFLASYLM